MAELLPLPPFQILKFLEDVAKDSRLPKKMSEEIRNILSKSPENGKMSSSDLYRVVEILKDRRKLLKEFNKFVKRGVGLWRDTKGYTHLYGDFPDAILVFPSKDAKAKSEPKAEIVHTAIQFERTVLSRLSNEDRDRIECLIQGKITSLDDLNLAVIAIANDKSAWDEELRAGIIMFGKLLPGHGIDGKSNHCIVDVWTEVSSDSDSESPRKMVVLFSPGGGWSFREYEETEIEPDGAGKQRKAEEQVVKHEEILVL